MPTIPVMNTQDIDYRARVIWEMLFREVKAWKWASLDSLLCDLKSVQYAIEQDRMTFYWWHSDDGSFTEVCWYPILNENQYRITWTNNTVTIEKN